ncbi:hypothetical protein F9L16_22910 [Agarivorans sp. B2Z047]|uniref:MATE family efflux transporter n=1 Tax=Agarivorans sp. B2Z047 TaxID=2652721 RepID=UPI00128E6C0A|nr:MATE family efflux transporter [Agarivorans sp. B2Z047]MPW31823.1 hypothetical protein [Agarivorans sp. B2Z047]UQN41939.1 hypothetical protein LQZ07_19500 [Agarivorans sp. B2Z047]
MKSIKGVYSFALTMTMSGFISISYGLTDILMVAPLGIEYVSNVGLGETIYLALLVLGIGAVDIFTSKYSKQNNFDSISYSLLIYTILNLLIWWFICLTITAFVPVFLDHFGYDYGMVNGVSSYLSIRALGMFFHFPLLVTLSVLRIVGEKSLTVKLLIAGAILNATLNYILLYSELFSDNLLSPEELIALSSFITVGITSLAAVICSKKLVKIDNRKNRSIHQLKEMVGASASISFWNLSDYLVSIVALLVLAKINMNLLPSIVLAFRVMSTFYRLPQGFCDALLHYFSRYSSTTKDYDSRVNFLKRFYYNSLCFCLPIILLVVIFSALYCLFFVNDSEFSAQAFFLVVLTQALFFPFYLAQHFASQALIVIDRHSSVSKFSSATYYLFCIPLILLVGWLSLDFILIVVIAELALVINYYLFAKDYKSVRPTLIETGNAEGRDVY